MGVERMGCGCLTRLYSDSGNRVHRETCMFAKDSTLMRRLYETYVDYTRENKDHEPWSFDAWQRHFNFKD